MKKAGNITRKKILNTAIKIFSEKGFLATRISDISKEAGIAHGLLYYYFKDKEHILQAIFEENWKDLIKNINQVIEHNTSVQERISAILSFIFHLFYNHPDLFRVIVINLRYNPEGKKYIRGELLQEFLQPLYRLFTEGQNEGVFRKDIEPEVAIDFLFGTVENSIRNILTGVSKFKLEIDDLYKIKESILKIFYNGVLEES